MGTEKNNNIPGVNWLNKLALKGQYYPDQQGMESEC